MLKILPEKISNLIAAGEVIQRPASVVKELLENSVDAGSTSITLIINDFGKTLIQVLDNGCGMDRGEAELCFAPHATSKIDTIEDLEKKIHDRDLLRVKINSINQLFVQGQEMDVKLLRAKAKEFIENSNNDPNLPERFTEDIPGLGVVTYTKNHVISVQNDVDTKYQAYLDVQNELVAAYNELRDEYAHRQFGKAYNELDEDDQKLVQKVYPQKISEAEPKNYGGL